VIIEGKHIRWCKKI